MQVKTKGVIEESLNIATSLTGITCSLRNVSYLCTCKPGTDYCQVHAIMKQARTYKPRLKQSQDMFEYSTRNNVIL
jgi:hypothetical protein